MPKGESCVVRRHGAVASAVPLLCLLAACATDRRALNPTAPAAPARPRLSATLPPVAPRPVRTTRVVRPAPPVRTTATVHHRPLLAASLARQMGLRHRDGGDHVVLEDSGMRVRIWKDSSRVSVAGRDYTLRGRANRRAGDVVVPAAMATWIERQVASERSRIASITPQPLPAVAILPVPPTPEPKEPIKEEVPEPVSVRPPPATRTVPLAWRTMTKPERAWKWIFIHHSADTRGNFALYDRIHREDNGWDECGYHFVIGNGSLSGDGEVEVGTRWPVQKHGAHCDSPDNCYNDFGIGICLVGNFEAGGGPSTSQMNALVGLCRWLSERYDIPVEYIVGHCQYGATECPGRHFPMEELRRRVRAGL